MSVERNTDSVEPVGGGGLDYRGGLTTRCSGSFHARQRIVKLAAGAG